MKDARRIVVTGVGPITASGIGQKALWEGLQRKRSPIGRITRFDPSDFRTHIAAEIDDFSPENFMDERRARRLDRYGQFAIAASRLALNDAELDLSQVPGERVGVQLGSALGGIVHAEHNLGVYLTKGVKSVDPRVALTVFCGSASCNIAIEFGLTGPNTTNAMSCASGTIAIGEAWRLIRDGTVDVALAGGIEAPLAPLSFGAFAIIRAMSARNDDPEHACRPFDGERDGFVMGEGASVLVLEELSHAIARDAPIYAELRGYGTTNDAHHMTAPRPDGSQAARAITTALERGELGRDEVEYVNAHGSSTPLNDSTESLAIQRALGPSSMKVPVSGTKPYYGHALGASGAIEAAICCLTMKHGWIPPTLNLEQPGEGCDLAYVSGEGLEQSADVIVSNSFGFGGINASLVLAKLNEA